MLRTRVGVHRIGKMSIGAHSGIIAAWRADRRAVEAMLPPPLEPTERTDEVMCFLNVTQTGLNMWLPEDDAPLTPLRTVHSLQANWHEANFFIQCAHRGEPVRYVVVIYKDVDHGVLLGIQNGYPTKLATFHVTFPRPGADVELGRPIRMTASRFDQLVIDARFTPEAPLGADRVPRLRTVGVRYFPDAVGGGPALLHDLVSRTTWRPEPGRPTGIVRAWAGSLDLRIGESELEGLGPLRPLETLPSWFSHLDTLSGPAHTNVLYDHRPRRT